MARIAESSVIVLKGLNEKRLGMDPDLLLFCPGYNAIRGDATL